MTHYDYPTFTGKGSRDRGPSYHISEKDALLVDMAIKLGRPLLIEGEAGCGKTTLASAVAEELGVGSPPGTPLIIPVRSSSRANDLFYRYDSLARFQDSRTVAGTAPPIQDYITLEPLGRAIVEGLRTVVVIDEVDKADMDFQNDLLFALERFEFIIDEIPARFTEEINGVRHRMTRKGPSKPIVIFTSNQEKTLPKPFLRRCLYLQLQFPQTAEDLVRIVESNLRKRVETGEPGALALADLRPKLVAQAVDSFIAIRAKAATDNAFKPPATSELIDWVHALHIRPDLADDLSGLTPPLWEMLFRTYNDRDQHAGAANAALGTRA